MKGPKRARKLNKTDKKRAIKRAQKKQIWVYDVAGSLHWNKPRLLDRFGAASPVRHTVKDGFVLT